MKTKLADRAQMDLDSARRVLAIEVTALQEVSGRLGKEFAQAVEILSSIEGKVIVTGLGKSGLICRKIAATLASTGTPALFLHAAEGLHGDIGMLARGDALIAVSNSGTTEEVVGLVAPARRLGLPVIALTGVPDAPLSRAADVCLSIAVAEEACPLGLAPTASTTVTLAIGDALAIALLERGGFAANDFGTLHPGGALGRRLRKVVAEKISSLTSLASSWSKHAVKTLSEIKKLPSLRGKSRKNQCGKTAAITCRKTVCGFTRSTQTIGRISSISGF